MAITKITTGFLSGNLFDGWDMDGINEDASVRKYAEAFEAKLRANYPDAEVEVDWQDGGGVEPHSLLTRVYFDDEVDEWRESQEIDDIDNIGGRVYADQDAWLVTTDLPE